ncbi:uncharacterized protein KQ657_003875 [Scheffersomyces spartinae]|uniref:Uncharacterized protein n=1 Tax=Scheffersomyces spartinae TaxID=45513 RepID=A0A9P8AKQ6_9ASCO|nr:uncharacterized protein KQ657_003875 [Scheffersomyces spartinae]KAG7195347.1 hypothetical protein KQ657_003875 [Scheffersomyces spartinae]
MFGLTSFISNRSIVSAGNNYLRISLRASYSIASYLGKWFQLQKVVYPPPPNQITTQNRLFPTYIERADEIDPLILFKDPTLVNFTYATPQCNEVTKALFDILGDKSKYPHKFSINLINVWADTAGGKLLMHKYVVGSKIPAILLLQAQLPRDKFVPTFPFDPEELEAWIRTIKQ